MFQAAGAEQRYCSVQCGQLGRRANPELVVRNPDRPLCRVAPQADRTCAKCGAAFSPVGRQVFCSPQCRNRSRNEDRRNYRRRARHYGVAYEPVSKKRVFERDRWRCGICRRKVNPRLRYPHDMSASLDHVVPMSLGGGHLYVNVQCAHLKCNVDKGAEGVGDQLALVG